MLEEPERVVLRLAFQEFEPKQLWRIRTTSRTLTAIAELPFALPPNIRFGSRAYNLQHLSTIVQDSRNPPSPEKRAYRTSLTMSALSTTF
jgi:hypothetical protein